MEMGKEQFRQLERERREGCGKMMATEGREGGERDGCGKTMTMTLEREREGKGGFRSRETDAGRRRQWKGERWERWVPIYSDGAGRYQRQKGERDGRDEFQSRAIATSVIGKIDVGC
ncbi:hypothetical protein ACLOJK_019955 [Asimina triloba]